jgi:hypothetical protein
MKKIHKEIPNRSVLSAQAVAAPMILVCSKYPQNSGMPFIPLTMTYLLKDIVFLSSLHPGRNDVVLFHQTHSSNDTSKCLNISKTNNFFYL